MAHTDLKESTRELCCTDNLFALYFAGEIPKEGFGDKYRPLDERKKQIENEIIALEAQIAVAKIGKVNRDYMLGEARALHSRWPELSLDKKRFIVQTITDEIIVGKEEISVRLEYLPEAGTRADNGTQQVGSPLG